MNIEERAREIAEIVAYETGSADFDTEDRDKLKTAILKALLQFAKEVSKKGDKLFLSVKGAVDYMERHPENAFLPIVALEKALHEYKAGRRNSFAR